MEYLVDTATAGDFLLDTQVRLKLEYLIEKRAEQTRLTNALNAAETEINNHVYRLFDLTPDEIRLLQKEVEH